MADLIIANWLPVLFPFALWYLTWNGKDLLVQYVDRVILQLCMHGHEGKSLGIIIFLSYKYTDVFLSNFSFSWQAKIKKKREKE